MDSGVAAPLVFVFGSVVDPAAGGLGASTMPVGSVAVDGVATESRG